MFPRNKRWSRARTRTTSGPDSDSHVSWLGQSRIVTRAIRGAIRQADSESHVALGSGVRAGPREEKTPYTNEGGAGVKSPGATEGLKKKASRSQIKSTKGDGRPFLPRRLQIASSLLVYNCCCRFRFRQYCIYQFRFCQYIRVTNGSSGDFKPLS